MSAEIERLLNAEAAAHELLTEVARLQAEATKYGQASKALSQTRDELSRLVASTQVLAERALDAVTATKSIGTAALQDGQKEIAESVDRLAAEVKATSERELRAVAADIQTACQRLDTVAQGFVVSARDSTDALLQSHAQRLTELHKSHAETIRSEVSANRDAESAFRASLSADMQRRDEVVRALVRSGGEAIERVATEIRDSVVVNLGDGLREMKAGAVEAASLAGQAERESIDKLRAEVADLRRESRLRQRTVMGLFVLVALLLVLVGALALPAVRAALGIPQ